MNSILFVAVQWFVYGWKKKVALLLLSLVILLFISSSLWNWTEMSSTGWEWWVWVNERKGRKRERERDAIYLLLLENLCHRQHNNFMLRLADCKMCYELNKPRDDGSLLRYWEERKRWWRRKELFQWIKFSLT